jgi:hypothetical protein
MEGTEKNHDNHHGGSMHPSCHLSEAPPKKKNSPQQSYTGKSATTQITTNNSGTINRAETWVDLTSQNRRVAFLGKRTYWPTTGHLALRYF